MRKFLSMELLSVSIAGGACASGIVAWGAVAPSAQIFGATVRRVDDASTMALTFDDGPNPAVTPLLLDLLERHAASATFFLIGKYVRLYSDLAREIAARGHVIGNHTDTHPALTFCSPSHIASELDRCDSALVETVGSPARWMRPPYGYRGPQLSGIVRARGKKGVVMWSASARDWKSQRAERVINRLRRARGGDIVLLHDGDSRRVGGDRHHTVAALEYWLPRWKDAGIRFVTLDEV
jgi:peptidoglycan-N-acetylglucosamine deacetylase